MSRATQTRGEVQRRTSIAAVHWGRLARVEADPHAPRPLGGYASLDVESRPERAPSKGEDRQRLVTTQLDQGAVVALDDLSDDAGELRRELSGRVGAL